MRKIFNFVAICAMFLSFASCGSAQKVTAQSTKSKAPFGAVHELPCGDFYDTAEKFGAVGIFRGSSMQKGQCIIEALELAKEEIRTKVHHYYQGMISNYSSTMGNNRGNDIERKLQRAGDEVIAQMFNDLEAKCRLFSDVFDDGTVECYVGTEMSKAEFATKTAKKVANMLTDEEKEKINFNEYNYRKEMEERMKKLKEEQQK